MRNLHLQHARVIRSPTVLRGIRCVHRPRKTRVDHGRAEELQAKHPSLYDEFFPKEIEQSASTEPNNNDKDIPRLPLSDLDQFGPVSHPSEDSQQPATNLTEASDKSAVKQWNLAVLVLNRVSKSLVDADFRRIAPKGRSLAEWTGPGDILKVIPGRDPTTLQQRNHYFLLFANPDQARTYQNHVTKLHRLAQNHTPTSLQSPLSPATGTMIEGEDAQTFLQDYALCPPSQRINTTSISAPFGNTVKQLVEHQGYPQLTVPSDRVGRAVLFWVDGYSSATRVIRSLINQDGRDRGLPWATEGGSRSVTKLDSPHISPEAPDALEQADSEVNRRSSARWIISFIDENEARRFVRAWHRRPWPLSGEWVRSEDAPLINAEFLW